jgi:hypothetical protein
MSASIIIIIFLFLSNSIGTILYFYSRISLYCGHQISTVAIVSIFHQRIQIQSYIRVAQVRAQFIPCCSFGFLVLARGISQALAIYLHYKYISRGRNHLVKLSCKRIRFETNSVDTKGGMSKSLPRQILQPVKTLSPLQ